MRILGLIIVAALSANAADCDRTCLTGMITRYVDALVAHKPDSLPLAPNGRFTEDSKDLKLGEGLWKTATKARAYRQDFIDVKQGIAASHIVVEEAGTPAFLSLVLHVADQKITGIETLVTHNKTDGALFTPENLEKPRPEMTYTPTPSQRVSRDEAIRLAMFYPKGLTIGSFVEVDAPFAADTYRLENGSQMAGKGCARAGCENIKAQTIIKHPDLKASVTAVDEEQGLVLLWMNFGNTGSYGAGNALVTYEAFKVWGGEIHAVQAFLKILPEATQRGWN